MDMPDWPTIIRRLGDIKGELSISVFGTDGAVHTTREAPRVQAACIRIRANDKAYEVRLPLRQIAMGQFDLVAMELDRALYAMEQEVNRPLPNGPGPPHGFLPPQ